MPNSVSVVKYEIIITDLKDGLSNCYTYSTYKEAIDYYVLYRDTYKDCKISLYALLKEEIL